jgi:hypothetical protein
MMFMPILTLGLIHLFYYFYCIYRGFLANLGLAKPYEPPNEIKMMIDECGGGSRIEKPADPTVKGQNGFP